MPWIRRPSGAAALIDPERGGTVHRLLLMGGGQTVEVLAGDETAAAGLGGAPSPEEPPGEPESITDDPGIFRGRLLVPFNDRIRRGRYSWRGTIHRLPINDPDQGDAIHGFLYRTPLTVAARRDGVLELEGSAGGTSGYPFPLHVRVTYRLEDSEFSLELAVRNTGRETAPLALGWHPYFTLPGADGPQRVDDLLLCIPAERYVAVDEQLIPTGSTPAVEGGEDDFRVAKPVGAREIDLAWLPDDPEVGPVTLSNGRHQIALLMSGAFRLVQVYIPPDRRSIALEPVSAATDSFNRDDCLELAPGETVRARAVVHLSCGIHNPVYARC